MIKRFFKTLRGVFLRVTAGDCASVPIVATAPCPVRIVIVPSSTPQSRNNAVKTHSSAGRINQPFQRLWRGGSMAMLLIASPVMAEVVVPFNNTDLLNTANTSLGTVTLTFTVDGTGNVTLDASTSNAAAGATNAVNAWDGPVGTVTFSGAFNKVFTLRLAGVGTSGSSNDLRFCNLTGGALGVAGTNQYRIDNNGNELIRFTATTVPAGKIKITSMDWRNPTGGPTLKATSGSTVVTKPATTPTGTWDLSSGGFLLSAAQTLDFSTGAAGTTAPGYSLGALRFDIISDTLLTAPTGLTAGTDGKKVVLDWNDTPLATSYTVYRAAVAGGPYGTPIATGLATSNYTDTTVSTGSTYYYVVTASDATPSESGNSNEVPVLVRIQPPTGLVRTQGDGVIQLDWADDTSGIFASHTVYRAETQAGPYTAIATGLTTSNYSDTAVTNGTTYHYRVTTTDNVANLESAQSAGVSGTPYVAIAGSSLYARLDGSVASSVTLDGADVVSLWADQTANGINATRTGGVGTVFHPSAAFSESGLEGVDMGFSTGSPKSTLVWFSPAQQDTWLDFSSGAGALPYGGFSVFAVVHPGTVLGGVNRDVVMSSTETEFSLRYEGGRPQVRLGNAVLQGAVGAVSAAKTVVLAVDYNAATGSLQLWDSQSRTTSRTTVPAADFSSTYNMYLGGSTNPDQYMTGMLGEASVHRGAMTSAEFAAKQAELSFKWIGLQTPSGLTASSGNGTVVLDWGDQVADFFTVYRSETEGGPYDEVATNITVSGFTDTTVNAGVTYHYVVTATEDRDGESPQSAAVAITPYTSIPGNSLYVHLDAARVDSVVTTDGIVETWRDQTSNGLDAIEVPNGVPGEDLDLGNVLYPGTSLSASGLAGLDFGPDRNLLKLFDPAAQDAWLDFSGVGAARPYGGFAVFIALKADSILGVAPELARDVVFANTDNIGGKFLIRYQSGRPEMYLNGVAAFQGANRITAGDTVILAANYDSATGALEFWDSAGGLTAKATVPAADFSTLKSMHLGGSINAIQRMNGMIGEVKIYRGAMTAAQFASEREALATKWITGSTGGYQAWQTANNTSGGINEDHDADGVRNGVEHFLGGNANTTGPTVLPGLVTSGGRPGITWNKGAGYAGSYGSDHWIETSSTLDGQWTMETIANGNVIDDAGSVRYTFPPASSGRLFVRLKVVRP